MQFSYSWLKSWANPNLSADELASVLTMSGLEVEEQTTAAPAFTGVVVAQVKSVEKHPDADRLNVTQVDTGNGELIQIVCGAPNVAVGVKVPCALSGAVLPGDFKIKPTKMRGQQSNGMLCSAKELGIAEETSGLLILPDDAPVGQNIREYLDLDDTLFTLKITPNRADCLSIKGIAREVKALTHCEATPLSIPKMLQDTDRAFATNIQAPNDCGRLLTRVIEGVDSTTPTPEWLKQRIERCGVRSVSVLVDIGNFVMLELGQPMHVFDLDKVSGSLNARRAVNGEKLECLNGKTVELKDDTLVIADDKGALSIAGMMGGQSSAVSDSTQNILLESAFFYPNIIAGKSRQYGFGSDSSFRFERGVDFALQEDAIERATVLIIGICGGKAGIVNKAEANLPERKAVCVRLNRIKTVLGIDVPENTVEKILTDLGLNPQKTPDGFSVTAPSFRFDIEIEEDLIEEIARVYGYDKVPFDSTQGKLLMDRQPETQKNRFELLQKVAGRDYREVINYAFVEEAWEQDFANNQNPIRLQNPIASQMSVMRSTLIGGLVATLQSNLNRKQSRVRLFEVARVFHKAEDGTFRQPEKVALLAFGNAHNEQWGENNRRVDFYDIKGDIENLLSGDIEFQVACHPALHPGRSAVVLQNGTPVGIVGELHPKWVQKYDLPHAPVVAELDFEAVMSCRKNAYSPVSKFQAVRRDLAFVVEETTNSDKLLKQLRKAATNLVKSIDIFDVYRGQGLPENSKSIAVKIILQSFDKTLQDEDSEQTIAALIAAAEEIGAKLRA
ncbi:MAG: phenylalanine--tRNA ligase subunit beta [Neisseriaceae bacterium]|nr:phenylalanine--tRNA ligase subunit beta [Neisseriaceae bacterium]